MASPDFLSRREVEDHNLTVHSRRSAHKWRQSEGEGLGHMQ